MKKLSVFCIVLILSLMVFISSCKTAETFNIVGTWTGNWKWYDSAFNYPTTFTFSGDENSGTVFMNVSIFTADGTYSVNGQSVTMNMMWNIDNPASITAHGAANDDFNSISGTFTQTNNNNGTWNASR